LVLQKAGLKNLKLVEYTSFPSRHKKETLFTSKLDLNLKEKLINSYIRSIVCYGAEIWKLRNVDHKYLDRFETWCWRMMEKISWTDRVRDEEILHRVKEGMNILYAIKIMNANWIGHVLCRN
jgi:hypothetical protein